MVVAQREIAECISSPPGSRCSADITGNLQGIGSRPIAASSGDNPDCHQAIHRHAAIFCVAGTLKAIKNTR